jgi:hypothetical protein
MAQVNFFATRSDLQQVFSFIFLETDFRVFESYSDFGRELREFPSFESLASSFQVGQDAHGNGTAVLLQMWSPTVCAQPEIIRITLDPKKCDGHTFRHRVSGYGLVQLYLGGLYERVVTHTHYGHCNERGAARWGDVSNIDWKALAKISGRFQRHLGRKLAVAKVPGYAVLPGAYEKFKEGFELKWAAHHPSVYTPIPLVSLKPRHS